MHLIGFQALPGLPGLPEIAGASRGLQGPPGGSRVQGPLWGLPNPKHMLNEKCALPRTAKGEAEISCGRPPTMGGGGWGVARLARVCKGCKGGF